MRLDARGLGCPKPVIMADEELSKVNEGIVEVLVDNEASVSNLGRFASKNAFYSETLKEDGYWRVKIVKGYPCEVSETVSNQQSAVSSEVQEESKKGIFFVVSSDVIGKDEELGKILMKGFFETMKVTKELPDTIFFLNAGVKLTSVDETIAVLLKEIEQMGVSMYSCSTCLKYYGIEDKLKIGQAGGMFILIEGMKDFKKTVWIG
ncbi:MAG: sulfurtransferase-like selenium metabolism protein YedF [Nitrospirae bacterium]|nr:sulfurtransferase-like selenium metabolism protein YedF [Nitrospirota bacterium]